MRAPLVYLAGPAYTPEEAEGMAALASSLDSSGFETYLPSRDGLGPPLRLFEPDRLPGPTLARVASALAVYQLADRCDCLVLNANGRVPDEGGTFEAAVAFSLGKPVVLYKRDHRTELHGRDNAMLTGLSHDFSHVSEAGNLPRELTKALGRYPRTSPAPERMPPHVRASVEMGRAAWLMIENARAHSGSTDPGELPGKLAALVEGQS